MIKTKIVATIGPASNSVAALKRLATAGMDVCRVNFSHGAQAEHLEMLTNIRRASEELGRPLAVMADLCGPKIRVGKLRGGQVVLKTGDEVTIQRKPLTGTANRISTTLGELIDDVRIGQPIRLDDGKIELKVIRRDPPDEIVCRIVTGGVLSDGKGANLPKTSLRLAALTEKDRADARWIAKRDIDYVALSFVQRAADVRALAKILRAGGSDAKIIAKIEKPQALKNIDAIADAADGLMVARGDLGVEMSLPDVPIAQKRLVRLCGQRGKICIVATQMLETMTTSPTPTRAEVSDVANAVWDGADAVMLSGETAVGQYPEKTVRMMDRIVKRAEAFMDDVCEADPLVRYGLESAHLRGAGRGELQAVARAVQTLVDAEDIRAVVAFTMTGATAVALSKLRLPVPVLALTPSRRVVQQACLLYGVHGREAAVCEHTREVLAMAAKQVRRLRWAKKGGKIVVVSGRPVGKAGTVNTLVMHQV